MTSPDPKYWPAWRYGPKGEMQIFERPEDVPEGWLDTPAKHAAEAKARAAAFAVADEIAAERANKETVGRSPKAERK